MSLRQDVIDTALKMNALGINQGTSGNVSARSKNGFFITPSGMDYDQLDPQDIVEVRKDGSYHGKLKPSSEWLFHHDIMSARKDVNAIIHTHSKFATTLACLRRDLPPFHYMIAVCGGKTVRCAPYATFGTQELSDVALKALQSRNACLLANHGMIVAASNLDKALKIAQELELLCEQYLTALQVGEPHILSDEEMDEVMEKFKTYGKQGALETKPSVPTRDPWSQGFTGYKSHP
ncbi:L-fuculose phosphate aldolase [Candidatus Terasakiella magnetica]|uniref:L-fuculose phosphate aldolase n=1 Tax=Candidatus Terasakiella magnetica TaxID=1867952 RepID=A0A1C3RJ31_9PROT|nr:class II aldolase/adducin family protein [Candidatus Terasakiella magnetica]SCA57273.1 L-fuculose phosphate aldolase [Candidatus Terasakiella magnetica]